MFKYYNANPLGRNVSDCAVRAISLATNRSWDETYCELSEFARREGITFSEIEFLNNYLLDNLYDKGLLELETKRNLFNHNARTYYLRY